MLVVDDGIATGATVRAALKALYRATLKKLVLAVPVAPADTLGKLRTEVDGLVCLQTPDPFYAIGYYYNDFTQIPDEDVLSILHELTEDRFGSRTSDSTDALE